MQNTTTYNGFQAEQDYVSQFGGSLVTNLQSQYADIDVLTVKDETVSVKFQPTSLKTGNFSFEYLQIDTRTNESIDGNFIKCQADWYAISDSQFWYLIRTSDLKRHVEEYKPELRDVKTNHNLENLNRQAGRKYDRARSWLVPVKDLRDMAIIVPHVSA